MKLGWLFLVCQAEGFSLGSEWRLKFFFLFLLLFFKYKYNTNKDIRHLHPGESLFEAHSMSIGARQNI